MKFNTTELNLAAEMDCEDELAHFRNEFVIHDPNLIYLDGNSLGRLPKRSIDIINNTVEQEWGNRLIRSWNETWMSKSAELGAKIAKLVGARADEIIVSDATSTNLFKLAVAALRSNENKKGIVSDVLNFPSDIYILKGVAELAGAEHTLSLIPSADNSCTTFDDVDATIKSDTALVSLSHVAFKSAFMYDMKKVTDLAHQRGALMLWDLCHSVGAVELDLNAANVDLAIGCTYKYLNGGPGSPAFLYVRKDLQSKLKQPIWGWFASDNPFAFDLDFKAADDISRFQVSTPPLISMKAMEPGLDILLDASMSKLRRKSIKQTDYLIYLAEKWLKPYGFILGTPEDSTIRGSHVSLQHPESYRICRALIESEAPAVQVIPDFRAPDNIRFGITPIYTTYTEIHQAMSRLKEIMQENLYEHFSEEQQAVT